MPTEDQQSQAWARQRLSLLSPASLYDNWLVAETHASLALHAWREARPGAKARAYAAYTAALAAEAHAANVLAARLRPAAV